MMELAHGTRAGMSRAVNADMIDGVRDGCVLSHDLWEGLDSGHNARKLRRTCKKAARVSEHVSRNI